MGEVTYVSRRGWTVSSEYVDQSVSGSKESRPELNRLDLTTLLRGLGEKTRPIPRRINIRGLGELGVETAQWIRTAGGKLQWEVRTGRHKRYKRMIVGRISLDRQSLIDFVYLSNVPRTKSNFRITKKMLRNQPRASLDSIVEGILARHDKEDA